MELQLPLVIDICVSSCERKRRNNMRMKDTICKGHMSGVYLGFCLFGIGTRVKTGKMLFSFSFLYYKLKKKCNVCLLCGTKRKAPNLIQ